MNWLKTVKKFIVGALTGSMGTFVVNQDLDMSGKIGLIIGVTNAVINWYKNRKKEV